MNESIYLSLISITKPFANGDTVATFTEKQNFSKGKHAWSKSRWHRSVWIIFVLSPTLLTPAKENKIYLKWCLRYQNTIQSHLKHLNKLEKLFFFFYVRQTLYPEGDYTIFKGYILFLRYLSQNVFCAETASVLLLYLV